MPQHVLNGVVVRYADYKDYDRILTLYTKERGLVSCAARGCRRPKSRLLQAAELFVSGEFVLFQNGDKYTLDACDVRETYYPLREDIARFSAGAYMLSLVEAGADGGEEPNDALMSLLLYALTYAAYSDCEPIDLALCFALRCLQSLGYRPAITNCALCGADLRKSAHIRFSPVSGGALCPVCARGLYAGGGVNGSAIGAEVSPLSLEAMRRMLLLRDEDINKVRLPQRVREELRDIVGPLAECVLERRFKAFDCI